MKMFLKLVLPLLIIIVLTGALMALSNVQNNSYASTTQAFNQTQTQQSSIATQQQTQETISPAATTDNPPSTASYRIEVNGQGSTTAVNASTGEIIIQSTNTSYIIQSTINSLQALGVEGGRYGGTIQLSNGIYTLTTGLIIDRQFAGVTIEGEGGGTTLVYSGSGAAITLTQETERNTLRDFQILLKNNSTCGIQIQHGQKNTIDNVIVKGKGSGDGNTGILIAGESHWNHISNTYIQNIQQCIQFKKTDVGYPHFNSISTSELRDTSYGLIIAAQNIGVSDTAIEQFAVNGITIQSDTGSYANFQNTYIESTLGGEVGLYIEPNAGGITWTSGTIITKYGTTIVDKGIGNNRWIGPGWENSGYVELSNGGTWNHALLSTPTVVQLTPLTAAQTPITTYVAGRNSTTITIALFYTNGTAVSSPIAVYWEAKYQP
jgi:hypothetical protein